MKGEMMILLPVLLPILAGIILPFIKNLHDKKSAKLYSIGISGITAIAAIWLLLQGDVTLHVVSMTDTISIFFKVDDMGRLFAGITILMWLLSAIYSYEYLKHEENVPRYLSFVLISLGALLGLCFSGNLITMYLFFELMTLMTMPLVLHHLTKEAISASLKYLFYSIGGAFTALLGFFYINKFCNGFEFIPGGILNSTAVAGNEAGFLVVIFFMILGFGSKAGMLPLHGWLPTAHPVAPAPASALLSGNITKMGVLAIIRVVYYIVGADFIRGTWVQYAWLAIALATIFMGSMLAYKEQILKKRLAYSTVSQVSYVMFGLALLNTTGLVGGLLHVVFHSIVKNTLFLTAGAIIYKTGKTKVNELTGIGKTMPVTMWCYTLASLTLIGIPPTSAFISKWYLAEGSLESGLSVISWLGPVILLVSALLTAGYLFTITMKGFFPGADFDYQKNPKNEVSAWMTLPLILLTVLAVIFGMFPNGLIEFLSGLSGSLI